jgi:hypothetical protein
MKKFASVLILLLSVAFLSAFTGCESCSRLGKSIKSSTVGIDREIVWTGFDGSRKVWNCRTKIDTNENSGVVYFIDDNGKTVLLGPGWYSVEK